jgi:hypothetical protein
LHTGEKEKEKKRKEKKKQSRRHAAIDEYESGASFRQLASVIICSEHYLEELFGVHPATELKEECRVLLVQRLRECRNWVVGDQRKHLVPEDLGRRRRRSRHGPFGSFEKQNKKEKGNTKIIGFGINEQLENSSPRSFLIFSIFIFSFFFSLPLFLFLFFFFFFLFFSFQSELGLGFSSCSAGGRGTSSQQIVVERLDQAGHHRKIALPVRSDQLPVVLEQRSHLRRLASVRERERKKY